MTQSSKTPAAAWRQLAIAMLTQAISGGSIFTAYSVIAAPLKATFEPSNMVLMLGITIVSLVSGVLSPALGKAIDNYSIRRLMLIGLALAAAGFFLLSAAQSMTQILVIYGALMAAASILLGPIATSALLARWFTHKRAMALGIAASGSAIGGLLFPPLIQLLIEAFEWRLALQLFAGLILFGAAPLIAWMVIDTPPATETDTPKTAAPTFNLRTLLMDFRFWSIVVIIGALFCGPIAIISNMIQMLGGKGISATQGALLISLFSATNFGGKLVFAAIADRTPMGLLLSLTVIGIAAGTIGLMSTSAHLSLALCAALIGLFAGFTTPLWSLLLAKLYGPENLGKLMGIMSLFIMPLTLASPPLFGWAFDVTGSYNTALLAYSGFVALTLPLIAVFAKVTRQTNQSAKAPLGEAIP